jgi:hypothetical protein
VGEFPRHDAFASWAFPLAPPTFLFARGVRQANGLADRGMPKYLLIAGIFPQITGE